MGFAACKSDPKPDTENRNIQLLSDSTVYNNNVFSDTTVTVKTTVPVITSETPLVITRTKKHINIPAKETVSAPVFTTPASVPPVATPPIATTPESTTVDNKTAAGTGNSDTGSVATTPQVEKKKGWSKAAQGAAIGGVTGAIGGAIISKKKGLGAVVVGGVVGAAGGYIIGKGMDKKDDRFNIE